MSKHVPKCDKCGKEGRYNEAFDSYYCIDCVTWIEDECGDVNCMHCDKRPSGPPNGHPSYCSECGCIKEFGQHATNCPKRL